MRYFEFIDKVNERVKEGKKFFKIVYDWSEVTRTPIEEGYDRNDILFVQTSEFIPNASRIFNPDFAILLNNQIKVNGSVGYKCAADIVDISMDDYAEISRILKKEKLKLNKKTGEVKNYESNR